MVIFKFQVNPSYINYSHPITIPKIYHNKIRDGKLDDMAYRIVYPKGETRRATMYHGRPGESKEYYQLTVPKRYQVLPDYLRIHESLVVLLFRLNGKNYAILEYPLN